METFLENCTGVILAGGENRRMPLLKAFIEVEGQKIIEKNLTIMKDLFREVFIVTNQPEAYSYLGVPMLGDVYDSRGPMTGIFTVLLNSSQNWVFITACDMPFIHKPLIKHIYSKRENFDAVVPSLKNRTEPLFALYSTRLLGSMEKAVLEDRKSLNDFLRGKRVQYIPIKEIGKLDPDVLSFVNLNTPADIDHYLQDKDKIRFKKKIERRGKCSV
jgi:molybdopterin-guanine dinucleotide biosynthesis protein A